MNVFSVSVFGHRTINDLKSIDDSLAQIIRELIVNKEYISFLIGRNGEFDEYAASVIKRVQKNIGRENSDITLVLPYSVSDMEYYQKYYDNIIIPDILHGVHPKAAITSRNRWMIEGSDLIVFYVEKANGGAYAAMKYAQKLNKNFVNIAQMTKSTIK